METPKPPHALLVQMVARLLPSPQQLPLQLLNVHAQSTPTESIAVLVVHLVRTEVPQSAGLLLLMLASVQSIFSAAPPSAIPVIPMHLTVSQQVLLAPLPVLVMLVILAAPHPHA